MMSFSYSHDIYSLFTVACMMSLMGACSRPAEAPKAVADWYEGRLYQDKPFYVTTNGVSWTSGRKNADFGRWTAVGVYDSSVRLRAEGRRFSITSGYGWDGVTWGTSTPDMLLPSLFHDAMLHAKMNGAPLSRSQIDLAFYDIMSSQNARPRGIYYRFTRLFGWCLTFPQHPKTLVIKGE